MITEPSSMLSLLLLENTPVRCYGWRLMHTLLIIACFRNSRDRDQDFDWWTKKLLLALEISRDRETNWCSKFPWLLGSCPCVATGKTISNPDQSRVDKYLLDVTEVLRKGMKIKSWFESSRKQYKLWFAHIFTEPKTITIHKDK